MTDSGQTMLFRCAFNDRSMQLLHLLSISLSLTTLQSS